MKARIPTASVALAAGSACALSAAATPPSIDFPMAQDGVDATIVSASPSVGYIRQPGGATITDIDDAVTGSVAGTAAFAASGSLVVRIDFGGSVLNCTGPDIRIIELTDQSTGTTFTEKVPAGLSGTGPWKYSTFTDTGLTQGFVFQSAPGTPRTATVYACDIDLSDLGVPVGGSVDAIYLNLNIASGAAFVAGDAFNSAYTAPDVAGVIALHYLSDVDVTTINTNPGDPGYGVPDGQVTTADLSYFVEQYLSANMSVADVTTSNTNPGDAGYGTPDGQVTGADLSYFVEQYNLATGPSPCP